MSDTKNIILQEVRSFFKNLSWKKILTFLFFILLSSVFWMMQIYRQKFESTLSIPVKYVNVPDSIVFENELPTDVYVRIKDDGASLFKYYFTKRKDSLTVDVRDIIRNSSEKAIQGKNLEQFIRSKLLVTSELISYSPTRMSYEYVVLREKMLPVIYDGYINLATGHILDGDLATAPDSVKAYGSRAALDTLTYAYTTGDTLYNVSENNKIEVALKTVKGVRFVPNVVRLNVPAVIFIKKEVEVPVRCVNLPSNLDIRFFPSSVKIPFIVGKNRANEITANNFEITVDYNDLKDIKESSIPVRITESPDYIQTEQPIPSEVEFVLERK
ncbi:hypothetical protein [Dysgonomonas sp. BGC7]|uniref:hypothetical protein n=1 Tax=Dysgonomonas sp. BGC7 TaxID=1658008 RepID=UPI000680C642|nr:hypothetical protein [Dysgonomonas sp. BGC7]MBD8388262.1 YbbR-like domain-containing protein [Dysgonomonas sp. BGC7]